MGHQGIEPCTSRTSSGCSPGELEALVAAYLQRTNFFLVVLMDGVQLYLDKITGTIDLHVPVVVVLVKLYDWFREHQWVLSHARTLADC
jgi:hypothetical protein